jgi:type IV pilus assembly protein PilQ
MSQAVRPGGASWALLAAAAVALGVGPFAAAGARDDGEARVSLDVKDAEVVDVASLLAEAAGLQAVFDPAVHCKLTLNVRDVRWSELLDVALRSCRLGREQEGSVLRVAPIERLAAEADDRRRFEEARGRSASRNMTRYRLSYARAREIAPLLKRFLSPEGEVVYDERTNTLIIID